MDEQDLDGRAEVAPPAEFGNWLLFLGAGASVPVPTQLPAFNGLVTEVLEAIGWSKRAEGAVWDHPSAPRYPPITRVDETAEVLFGRLNELGVPFARPLSTRMTGAPFNAVHEVAAAVLQADGCVWTTNIDAAVEAACAHRGLRSPRTGRTSGDAMHGGLQPLDRTAAGTLVKFHGTVEHPDGLALADLQLLTPLPRGVREHLRHLARRRKVVVHGYQGADADLADLLEDVFGGAASITWFEPSAGNQAKIRSTFPSVSERIAFIPPFDASVRPDTRDIPQTSAGFLSFVRVAGHEPSPELAAQLIGPRRPDPETSALAALPVSGATQARIVQHFGVRDDGETARAWALARRSDLMGRRWQTVPLHIRHLLAESTYAEGGWLGAALRWSAHRPAVFGAVRPKRVGDAFVTRAMALLLDDGDLDALRELLGWARAHGSTPDQEPVNNYYRAHVARYDFRPDVVWHEASAAIEGMEDILDPQRLASALFEAGCAAIYRADFEGALRLAFELQYRRGRYAIPRWRAWGAWLETVANAHLGNLPGTVEPLANMKARFAPENSAQNEADVRTIELLLVRLRMAVGVPLDPKVLTDDGDAGRRGRYRDDLDLALADIAIARKDWDEARSRLERVTASPVAVSVHCARRGLAEVERRTGKVTAAANQFADLAAEAGTVGATWYQVQAVVGLELCGDARAKGCWQSVERAWPATAGRSLAAVRAVSGEESRPLWLVTI